MNARQTGTPVGACDCEVQSNSTDFNRKPVTGCEKTALYPGSKTTKARDRGEEEYIFHLKLNKENEEEKMSVLSLPAFLKFTVCFTSDSGFNIILL